MWNERYSAKDRVWSATPNRDVEAILSPLDPGTAVDLGAGEGRHAIWLASRGWQVTAVDYAAAGLARGQREAAEQGLREHIAWEGADVTTWEPTQTFDLVLIAFLHIPEDVFARAASWLNPGGHLVMVGHALRNLTEGSGGPQDESLLHTPEQASSKAEAADLQIVRLEEVERTTDSGATAIDLVLVATAPA